MSEPLKQERKATITDFGILWLRLLMGAGIAYHGYMKLFGGKMEMFIEGVRDMGFPTPELFAWAAVQSEFLGGILVFIGFGTRFGAFFIFCTMTIAAFVRHGGDPFSAKELALAYWTIAGALFFTGGGYYSFDRKLKPA